MLLSGLLLWLFSSGVIAIPHTNLGVLNGLMFTA